MKANEREINITMRENNGCSGWRYPEECPNNGVFDQDSKECKDCEQDMLQAMSEDADREMIGDDVDFGLGDIGGK